MFENNLPISLMDYVSVLLKAQFNVSLGLYPPSYVYAKVVAGETLLPEQVIPRDAAEAVQIHFINSHYVVSYYHEGSVTVFDSLPNATRCADLNPQLKLVYASCNAPITIGYKVPQTQGCSTDCGLFAIYNAYSLLKHEDPACRTVKQNEMRNHIYKCLTQGIISDFPASPTPNWLQIYMRDQQQRCINKAAMQNLTKSETEKTVTLRLSQSNIKNKHELSERNRISASRKQKAAVMSQHTKLKHDESERKCASDYREKNKQTRSENDNTKQLSEGNLNSDCRKKRKEIMLEYDQFKHSERKRISDLRKRKKESMSENDLLKQKHRESIRISVLTKKKKETMSENDLLKQKHRERERKMHYRKRNKQTISENDKLKQQLIERKQKSNYRKKINKTMSGNDQFYQSEKKRISDFRKKKKVTISESDLLKQQESERNRKNIYRKRNKESMSENAQFKHSERKRISDFRKRKKESISEYDQLKHAERKRTSDLRKRKKETILEYDQFKHSERKRISDLRKRKKESISEYDQFKHSERKRTSDLRKRKKETILEYDQFKHSERKRISGLRKRKKETILEYDQFKHSERKRISDLRKRKKETILEYDQFKHSERRRISDLRKKKKETMSENEQWNQQLSERKRKINERKKYTKTMSKHDNQMEKEHERLRVSNYRKQKRLNVSKAALQRSLIEAKKRKLKHRHPTNIYLSIKNFQTHIRQYAEYICTCCNRLLYRKSVVLVTQDSFKTLNAGLRKKCVTQRKSKMGFEWICNTCSSYLKKGKMPPQANANCLETPTVPDELKSLSPLEVRLLSQRYPFMKILALPKGKQCGLKGSVVNIPVNEKEVCSTLPRTPQKAGLIPLRLKRRIKYKGHVKFQFIRPDKIRDALHWLQLNDPLYQHIKENSNWENDCIHENEETWAELTVDSSDTNSANLDKTANQRNSDASNTASSQVEKTQSVDSSNTNSANVDKTANQRNSDASNTTSSQVEKTQSQSVINTEEFDDDYSDDPSSKLRGLHYETCVQTVDPTVDVDKILNIAPNENKRPIHILMDESFEEMAFPHLLPTGKFGWKYERPLKLTPKKYFQRRLLDADPRFAQDIEYLFVAQTVVEIKQIQDSMSIALKKAYHASPAGEALTAGVVRDSNSLKQFILKDQAYRYLQPIRGSPPYWQRVQYKLLAAIKQYGIFTWFFTLSAADLRWHDTIQEIAAQQGETISDEEIDVLTWEDKCKRLRSNPVSAARHFQYRLDCFMRDLILAKSEPLGHVVHYFYRIEFQVRGSPHAHGVLWIKDAPDPEKDRPEVICKFVDRYVQCSLPSPEEDPELHSLVNNLQRHTHSHSCRKTGKLC